MSPHNIIWEKLAKAYSKVLSTLHMEKFYSGSFHRPKSLELHAICVKDHWSVLNFFLWFYRFWDLAEIFFPVKSQHSRLKASCYQGRWNRGSKILVSRQFFTLSFIQVLLPCDYFRCFRLHGYKSTEISLNEIRLFFSSSLMYFLSILIFFPSVFSFINIHFSSVLVTLQLLEYTLEIVKSQIS